MITVEGVTRRYGAFTAVDDVSVTAHAAFEPMARLIADGDDDDVVAAFESMLSPEDPTLLADPRLRAEAVVNARESIRQGVEGLGRGQLACSLVLRCSGRHLSGAALVRKSRHDPAGPWRVAGRPPTSGEADCMARRRAPSLQTTPRGDLDRSSPRAIHLTDKSDCRGPHGSRYLSSSPPQERAGSSGTRQLAMASALDSHGCDRVGRGRQPLFPSEREELA
jgi:hypothetical protein